ILWDLAKKKEIKTLGQRIENHFRRPRRSVFFSPDGQRVVAATGTGGAKVWDVVSYDLLREIGGRRDEPVALAAASDDGTIMATLDTGGLITFWGTGDT